MDNNEKSEILNKKRNLNLIIIIIIVIVALLIGGICGFFISQSMKSNSNENNIEENNNTNEIENNTNDVNKITGKHKFSDYCSNNGSCKKNIGIITIGDQELNFSIDLNNINTENVSGNISLGSNTKNISDLSYFQFGKSFDGFEVYQDYLIIYTSDLQKEKHANCRELEGLRGYHMYIFDVNLNEVSGLSGYTLNDAFTDIKIDNGFVYYYGMLATGNAVVYDKISFNDLLIKNWDGNTTISTVKECK